MLTRFYIEKRKDDSGKLILKDRPVFMSVSIAGDRLMLGTGIKSDFHAWDPGKQRMKESFPGSGTANSWLDTLSETAQRASLAMQSKLVEPNGEEFRRLFLEMKPKFSRGFFEVFFLFLEWGMKEWSTASYRKVRTIYRHLREFEDKSGFGMSFGTMNNDFLRQFQDFYAEKGNSLTTTHKAVNILVWFLNWSSDRGYNVNLEYKKFYQALDKGEDPPVLPLFLKWDELSAIRDMNCDSKRKERVRDLFCFMCFTGMRFSELQGLRKEDVGDKEILVRSRNGKLRRVHLNAPALEILSPYKNKYYLNNTAFPSLSIVTMNKYLEILASEAGLNRKVTAGMAVNTFLANAIRLKISLEVISGFTGLKNDSRFRHIRKELEKLELEKFADL